jgi:1-acyl-sn-glycerol-3-phosphate acyltransferase
VTHEEANRLARERGPSRLLYKLVRGIIVPFMRVWFRLSITGAENIPKSGPAIVTPNHKSFWDSFFVGAATKRELRFMGKSELFDGPQGRLLVALGAFPVERGASDTDALETARVILDQGGLLSMFPEGTRIREPDELGPPKRGAARLAIEAGAPLIPAAITGTDHLFMGPLPRPKKVRLAIGEAVSVDELEPTPEAAEALVDEALWPEVETQFRGLRASPGAIAVGLAALGLGGAAVAAQRRRAKPKGPLDRLRRRAGADGRGRRRPRLRR